MKRYFLFFVCVLGACICCSKNAKAGKRGASTDDNEAAEALLSLSQAKTPRLQMPKIVNCFSLNAGTLSSVVNTPPDTPPENRWEDPFIDREMHAQKGRLPCSGAKKAAIDFAWAVLGEDDVGRKELISKNQPVITTRLSDLSVFNKILKDAGRSPIDYGAIGNNSRPVDPLVPVPGQPTMMVSDEDFRNFLKKDKVTVSVIFQGALSAGKNDVPHVIENSGRVNRVELPWYHPYVKQITGLYQ